MAGVFAGQCAGYHSGNIRDLGQNILTHRLSYATIYTDIRLGWREPGNRCGGPCRVSGEVAVVARTRPGVRRTGGAQAAAPTRGPVIAPSRGPAPHDTGRMAGWEAAFCRRIYRQRVERGLQPRGGAEGHDARPFARGTVREGRPASRRPAEVCKRVVGTNDGGISPRRHGGTEDARRKPGLGEERVLLRGSVSPW